MDNVVSKEQMIEQSTDNKWSFLRIQHPEWLSEARPPKSNKLIKFCQLMNRIIVRNFLLRYFEKLKSLLGKGKKQSKLHT